MRAVSFVDRLEFNFPGNICKNAIVLGDVDNDQNNELIVGNIHGDIVIFKGEETRPWASGKDFGMVSCLVVGDILNENQNFLVNISGDGWCHIFQVNKEIQVEDGKRLLIPIHTQPIPANTKCALLADIDGDGYVELVLGLTDRVVRTYRWADLRQNIFGEPARGKLVGLHKWEFANHVGGISVNPTTDGLNSILVAQPGGTYTQLQCTQLDSDSDEEEDKDADLSNNSTLLSTLTPKHHPLTSSRMRTQNISTEIMGGIKGTISGQPTNSLMAIATLDGTLMLVDGDTILWSLQVDHQLFVLNKLDLIGDGYDEVIACSWDGQTYIINQAKQSVRFQFEEHVSAMTAGTYSLNSKKSCTCLVYATFNSWIYLYYNVILSNIKTRDFLQVAQESSFPDLDLLKQLNVNMDSSNPEMCRQLYHWLLYGRPASWRENSA